MSRHLLAMHLLALLLTHEACSNWIEWRKEWESSGRPFNE